MNIDVDTLNKYWTDIYFLLHYPHKEKITHQVIRIVQLVEKRDNVGIGEISSYLAISHNTASENVERIIKRNYLVKKRDTSDERKVVLELTDSGREVLQRNTSLDKQKLYKILNDMTPKEMELLDTAFRLLKERAKNVPLD